ncbi:MAG TPA: UTP--glucose-1-phosphate uridylyltransferase GalU [Acidimicrobiia bacterium]
MSTTKPVTKAVIPAAGLGTRFLPVTKSQPKEMLPVVDKPSIQYVVEEAVAAGLTDLLVITGRGKHAIEDHFDRNFELEHYLEEAGKLGQLEEIRVVNDLADIHYIRQRDPLGLGHAVSIAREHVGGQPFAVLLGDDIMVDDARLLRSMLEVYERERASVLALLEVTPEEIASLGCAEVDMVGDSLARVRSLVEKPRPEEAPSNLAVIGRYVFTPSIFDALDRNERGVNGEYQLTDAIGLLLDTEPVYGRIFSEGRYDIGKVLGFLQANIELALARDELGPAFSDYLGALVRTRGIA